MCTVQDCERPVVAHGLCDMHRKRLARHGHLKKTRPQDWGQKEKHPLNGTYQHMKRLEHKYPIHESWKDFWTFVNDVGERPSTKHKLYRKDIYSGYGPDNFIWVEIIPNKNKAEYAKQWRQLNPDKAKNIELRKKFGITLEDYNNLLEQHNHCCAICGNTDKHQALSIDHCHETGKIRGLLCNYCNRALGMFKDSITNLVNAVQYLENNQ